LDSLRPKSGNGESIGLRTLLFLSVTARPLSEREAVQAISSKSRTLDDILAECAGMVVFDADKDQLLAEHPMCLDFLCSPQLDLFPDGHVRVLTTCLSFLSMEIEPTAPSTEQLLTEYPFLAYAARWWLYHAHRDERPSLIGPFLENEVARERWLAIWERLDPQ
jgi:hypothetical protein